MYTVSMYVYININENKDIYTLSRAETQTYTSGTKLYLWLLVVGMQHVPAFMASKEHHRASKLYTGERTPTPTATSQP